MMTGWTVPLQRASYRGVHFEVISVDDNVERATVEHAYPFVNGADIEDLGLNPLTVSMQAVLYGEGYYTDFKKLLAVLNKPGADVLVHPVRGRLQNMICTSAYFRHEAEFVDYATLDLQFKEATPAKPIFVFNSAFLTQLDQLLSELEGYVDSVQALWAEAMEVVAFAKNVKARLLGVWGGLVGCFGQVVALFGLDKNRYQLSASTTPAAFKIQSDRAIAQLGALLREELLRTATRPDLSTKARFDELLRTVRQVKQIPRDFITGKNQRQVQPNAVASTETQGNLKSLTQALSWQDVQVLDLVIHLFCTGVLVNVAAQIIEADSDELTPAEVDYLATQVRLEILENLNQLRQLQQTENAQTTATTPTTGLYTQLQTMAENLRNQAQQIRALALATINRKPPLILRLAEFDGTVQQHAHAIYGDFRRAPELLRLNPQLSHPNFIRRGSLINSYAK